MSGDSEMGKETTSTAGLEQVRDRLRRNREPMKKMLSHCMRCSLCAESCFLFLKNNRDPKYMPAYKVIHSVGTLYRLRGRLNRQALEKIKEIVWHDCVLCQRCYCPIGVSVPRLIGFARSICRSQGIFPDYARTDRQESWL